MKTTKPTNRQRISPAKPRSEGVEARFLVRFAPHLEWLPTKRTFATFPRVGDFVALGVHNIVVRVTAVLHRANAVPEIFAIPACLESEFRHGA